MYSSIISLENLFDSWHEFRRGKKRKKDVQLFELRLEDNIFSLHQELRDKSYQHSHYTSFYITDPKVRHIHKAVVKDRIVHHAIYRVLYPIFDKSFIYDSYSCRVEKGTHRAIYRFERFARIVSKNYSQVCFVLKCDVRRFFASIDHEILKGLIRKQIYDEDTMWLVDSVINSFGDNREVGPSGQMMLDFARPVGTPIGNLTSQLFANIYLNELDQFVKHKLKVKYYIRYCDDFVIMGNSEQELFESKEKIACFLREKLKLNLHKDKVSIGRLSQGIDFLGYVTFPHHRILRTKTKKRLIQRVNEKNQPSYMGVLRHCNGYKLENIVNIIIEKQKKSN